MPQQLVASQLHNTSQDAMHTLSADLFSKMHPHMQHSQWVSSWSAQGANCQSVKPYALSVKPVEVMAAVHRAWRLLQLCACYKLEGWLYL
jgi:hypothetical protein